MEADKCGMCLFEAMDHHWFHQIVISSKHTSLPTSNSPNYSSQNIFKMPVIVSDQQISSSSSSAVASSQVESKRQESSDHVEEITTSEDWPTKLYLVSRKTRSHSSSPTSLNQHSRLQKSVKSLDDLELQEVKGFMDLGFVFKKHNLSRHVISLIPGLQRLIKEYNIDDHDEEKIMMRPYLSESWLLKMPDSPLVLSLRISRVCKDSDKVKKHLKDWARTVASAIQQEF